MKENEVEDPNVTLEAGWASLNNSEFGQAQATADQLVSKLPDRALVHYFQGHVYYKQDLFRDAICAFNQALEKDDSEDFKGHIYFWLGRAYNQKPWRTGSIRENYVFDKKESSKHYALARETDDYPADAILSDCHNFSGKKLTALYEMGISKFPEMEEFYLLLSAYYKEAGLERLRDQTIDRGIDFGVISSALFYFKASSLLKKDEIDGAVDFLKKAIGNEDQEDPSTFWFHYLLGLTARKMNKFHLAQQHYISSIASAYWDTDKWFGFLGLLEMSLNKDEPNLVEELILNFDLDGEMFERTCNLLSKTLYLALDLSEEISLEGLAELYGKVQKLKLTNSIALGKLWLIKFYMASALDKHQDAYKAIKQAKNLLTSEHYTYTNKLHVYAIHDLVLNCQQKDVLVTKVYDIVVKDHEVALAKNQNRIIIKDFVELLYERKFYDKIVSLSSYIDDGELAGSGVLFEMAFSFVRLENYARGKVFYELYLSERGDSSAALNNLGLIYASEGNYEQAVSLYQRGLLLASDDKNLNSNLRTALAKAEELDTYHNNRKILEQEFRESTSTLQQENQFILDKLGIFIQRVKADECFSNWTLPVAKYKFCSYLGLDKQRAESIRLQWLKRGYLKETGKKDGLGTVIYQINPFIENELDRIQRHKIPRHWLDNAMDIQISTLEGLDYFLIIDRISKVNKKYRVLFERDFNELTFNYLMGFEKATIVLSGSLVELGLIFYLERKKLREVTIKDTKGNTKKKKLYDCVLSDLIDFALDMNFFGRDFGYLGNLSRVYRNFIHPGKELKEPLDRSKADLCFLSTREILKKIL